MKTSKSQFRMNSIFTLIIVLYIFSTSTFASKYEKMKSKPIEMVTSSHFDFFIHYLSNDSFEESLPVESWMLNPESFVKIEIKNLTNNNNEETALELENWMMDVQAFIPDENEPELVLENWMLNVDAFIDTPSSLALK